MGHIFLSHSAKDGAEKALDLARALEATGRTCWIAPRDVTPGVQYPEQIMSAIRNADGLVLIATAAANDSMDVLQEVQIAHSFRKPIAAIIVNGTALADALRYFLGVRHQLHWSTASEACTALVGRLFSTRADNAKSTPGASVLRELRQAEARSAGLAALHGKPISERLFRDLLADETDAPQMVAIELSKLRSRGVATHLGFSVYPVTWAEYELAVSANSVEPIVPDGLGGGPRPVTNVSWHHAIDYCDWLTSETGFRYRLPTNEEWEFAARAGTTTPYWWGKKPDISKGAAIGPVTAVVGMFPSNPFGLKDVQGNVWEWTSDTFNGSAAITIRGGRQERIDKKLGAGKAYKAANLGIRLVREFDPS